MTQRNLVAAATSDGGLVFAGEDDGAPGSAGETSIVWRKNTPPGNISTIAGNDSDDQLTPAAAGLTGDRFVIVWADESSGSAKNMNTRMSVFNNAGTNAVKDAVDVANTAGAERLPSVASTTTGGFVVTWSDDANTAATRIMAQRYDSEGNALGRAIIVDDTGDNDRSDVIGIAGGGFAAVWQGTGTGSQADIWLRLFNSDGTPRTAAVRVNSGPAGNADLSITTLANGFITVPWTHNVTGSNNDLYFRTFTANNANPITPVFRFQETDVDAIDQLESVIASSVDGLIYAAWRARRRHLRFQEGRFSGLDSRFQRDAGRQGEVAQF